jgi:hypothetical protein
MVKILGWATLDRRHHATVEGSERAAADHEK